MRDAYEFTRDGPYVRIVLPDVLPSDWDALDREIGDEVDDGVTRVTVMAGDAGTLDTHGDRLTGLVRRLEDQGVETVVVWQEIEPAGAPAI